MCIRDSIKTPRYEIVVPGISRGGKNIILCAKDPICTCCAGRANRITCPAYIIALAWAGVSPTITDEVRDSTDGIAKVRRTQAISTTADGIAIAVIAKRIILTADGIAIAVLAERVIVSRNEVMVPCKSAKKLIIKRPEFTICTCSTCRANRIACPAEDISLQLPARLPRNRSFRR